MIVFQIISYTGGKKYIHGDSAFMKGVDFTAADPGQGEASLSISSLAAYHAGTYQCKVKKTPGVDSRKISLVVMGTDTCFLIYLALLSFIMIRSYSEGKGPQCLYG